VQVAGCDRRKGGKFQSRVWKEEWFSFSPLVAAVLITPNGAESPGTFRTGVIGALVFI